MGYLGATLTLVFTHAGGTDVSLRDVTIAQMGNGARECRWRHAPEARGGSWGFWRKSVELSLAVRRRKVTFACSPRPWAGVAQDGRSGGGGGGGARWISQNRKNVYLSPYVEEPLNSKVIKGFVPALRSRKCFSCFEIPMFYVYMLWTLYVHFAYPYQARVH